VILTDPSYYVVPPLNECDELVVDGQCVVEGFTIGRKDFGEIHFPGKTDIYGLNLDKDEHDELVWLIETMGLEEAEAECARSRAMLIRSGQLDSNHAIWESEGGGVSRQGPAGQLPSPTSSHRMSGQ